MTIDEIYIKRCIDLAKLGKATTAPNPMVGAVLVHHNRIIAEGFHQQFGGNHAEVNCIQNVKDAEKHLIKDSTLYVSLEPCNHFGKTPPCSHFIVANHIKRVVIGCKDEHSKVNGAGIQYLLANGVNVEVGILQKECLALNQAFFYSKATVMPYVTLKWAQSADGYLNDASGSRTKITNSITDVFVHKYRSEQQAIIVGSNTIVVDNPLLNNRYFGKLQPIRVVFDRNLKLKNDYNIFNNTQKTIVFNQIRNDESKNVSFVKIESASTFLENALDYLYQQNIQEVLVEGGAALLNLFIEKGLYQKIVRITNQSLFLENGIIAPNPFILHKREMFCFGHDKVEVFY